MTDETNKTEDDPKTDITSTEGDTKTDTTEQDKTKSTESAESLKKISVEPEPKTDWVKYEDESLESAAGVMKDAGLAFDDAQGIFAKALETNDLKDVDLPALEKAIGKDKASLVMLGVKDYYQRNLAEVQATAKTVHGVFEGEESYLKVKDWFLEKAKIDEAIANDLKKYGEMFNAGGVSARAAALDMKRVYTSDPETSGLEVKIMDGDTKTKVIDGIEPLTRKESNKLLKEAHKNGDQKKINEIHARRRAGMKAGI